MNEPLIGFIGQGYIGKNYADDFEARGYSVVRYALEEPFVKNKTKISECDIVFIAVPTPTTKKGFDDSIVRSALGLVGNGRIAVVKSTIIPGSTKEIQKNFPDLTILVSPEFLSEATAAYDAANPFSNIVGMPVDDDGHRAASVRVHEILPNAPFSLTCDSDEAELVKYAHNISGYTQIVTFNLVHEFSNTLGHSWENIGKALLADPLISNRYSNPVHKSGRGAGGHCFIKDFAAFANLYEECTGDTEGINVFRSLEEKNKKLLKESGKDHDILSDVYGDDVLL